MIAFLLDRYFYDIEAKLSSDHYKRKLMKRKQDSGFQNKSEIPWNNGIGRKCQIYRHDQKER